MELFSLNVSFHCLTADVIVETSGANRIIVPLKVLVLFFSRYLRNFFLFVSDILKFCCDVLTLLFSPV